MRCFFCQKIFIAKAGLNTYFAPKFKKKEDEDLFDRIIENKGPLGKWASQAEGYFVFPKLEGPISNRMKFRGKDVITWSINDYLGLANLPEIKAVDSESSCRTRYRLSNGSSYDEWPY